VLTNNLWEGCFAYLVEDPARESIARVRDRILSAHPFAPPHLQLPLHVTVKYLGNQQLSVQSQLAEELRREPAPSIDAEILDAREIRGTAGWSVQLGLTRVPSLIALQARTMALIEASGAVDCDLWTGEAYSPHITVADGLTFPSQIGISPDVRELMGTRILLSRLVLFRKPAAIAILPELVALWR
jgi:2'-5' RNA ligase